MTFWLRRGVLVGAAFIVLLVLFSLPMFLEHAELVKAWLSFGAGRKAVLPLPPPPVSYILTPVLLAFFLGVATSGLWAYFARSRRGLWWAVLAGFTLPVFFTFVTLDGLNEYLFALTFTAFDPQSRTVPAAVAQLSGRESQPLYLTILYTFTGLLLGTVLWAGLRWAKLRRLEHRL